MEWALRPDVSEVDVNRAESRGEPDIRGLPFTAGRVVAPGRVSEPRGVGTADVPGIRGRGKDDPAGAASPGRPTSHALR